MILRFYDVTHPITPADTLPNLFQLDKVPLEMQCMSGPWGHPQASLFLNSPPGAPPWPRIPFHALALSAPAPAMPPCPGPPAEPGPVAGPQPQQQACSPTGPPGGSQCPGWRLPLGLPCSQLGQWERPWLPGHDLPLQGDPQWLPCSALGQSRLAWTKCLSRGWNMHLSNLFPSEHAGSFSVDLISLLPFSSCRRSTYQK